MKKYRYEIHGTTAMKQTWETSGVIEALPGMFPAVCTQAMKETFGKINKGEAVFGLPGVFCLGPYTITSLKIEMED